MLENFGDAPFFADEVPPATVAAIIRAGSVIRTMIGAPVGAGRTPSSPPEAPPARPRHWFKETKAAVEDMPLFLGSGVNVTTAKSFLEAADGLIIGTATKPRGEIMSPVDADLASEIVRAVS